MANLLGQDIGLNYKGLINIGSTINQNISASLQSLTDGDGNLLPLQISTTQMSVGGATGTGRLIVRGDGTNPIFRTEHTDGIFRFINTPTYTSVNVGNGGTFYVMPNIDLINGLGFEFFTQLSGGSTYLRFAGGRYQIGHMGVNDSGFGMSFSMRTGLINGASGRFNFATTGGVTATTGTMYGINFTDTFAAAAGSANYRPLSINYTINNSGAQTGTMTGIFLNATETALNGMTHNLMDLQVGGVSRFRVINTGNIVIGDASAPSTSKLNVAGDIFLRTNDSIGGGQTYSTIWNKIMLYNSSNGEMTITMYNTSWFLRHNANMSIAGNTVIGTTTPSARLHVRGDGTNPIARFETSAGVERVRIASDGALSSTSYSTDVQRLGFNGGTFGVNRGYIRAESNGVFTLSNAAENDFGRLNYGLATSSFPALKRSTTILQARLADDSDFTFIQGKLRTETNFISDPAIVADGYIVLYDSNGTAYKVLATAL